MDLKACIFDLDGVIVDTAKYHFLSWQKLATELGVKFSEENNKELKGVSRMGSLDYILELGSLSRSPEEKEVLANRKNAWYLEYISKMSTDEILEGSIVFLDELRENGIKISLGSGSKNAKMILEKTDLLKKFDAIVDGTDTTRGKPDPEVFLKAADKLEVNSNEAIVFEDAYKGVQAAKNGGFYAIGIGSADELNNADAVYSSLKDIQLKVLSEKFAMHHLNENKSSS
jgi:beta-phosphoglucomutase